MLGFLVGPFTAKAVFPDGVTALANVGCPVGRADGTRDAIEAVFAPARDAGPWVEFGGSADPAGPPGGPSGLGTSFVSTWSVSG